jgi:hypothetical protein
MKFKPTSFDDKIYDEMKGISEDFFDSLGDRHIIQWEKAQAKGKKGTYQRYDPVEAKMFIRCVADAMKSQLLLGIVIKGDFVGVAKRDDDVDFTMGDLITDHEGNVYEINKRDIQGGGIYTVVDLSRVRDGDIGDLP